MENGDVEERESEEREIAVGKGQNFSHVIRNTTHDKYAPNLTFSTLITPLLNTLCASFIIALHKQHRFICEFREKGTRWI